MAVLIWGAGKIGRGFVAEILREGGCFIDFVDKNEKLVSLLNAKKAYTIYKADENGIRKTRIEGGFAAHTPDDPALEKLFEEDELLIDVAVFKQDLDSVADMLAPRLIKRARLMPESRTDIITNVNMTSPEKAFREMLEARMRDECGDYLKDNVGVSGIFMMCISPDATAEMLKEDPLAVYNNGFFEQAVDVNAFRGKAPSAPRLRLSGRLEAEEARKLYTLNMAHASLAYLGLPKGHETSYEAICDKELLAVIEGELDEAAAGLIKRFCFTEKEMAEWKEIILSLLRNRYMADPLKRLGADTRRKLGKNDRLVMPIKLCREAGREPANLIKALRAGYAFENDDEGTRYVRQLVETTGIDAAMREISGEVFY